MAFEWPKTEFAREIYTKLQDFDELAGNNGSWNERELGTN